jgi:hypothetical protein
VLCHVQSSTGVCGMLNGAGGVILLLLACSLYVLKTILCENYMDYRLILLEEMRRVIFTYSMV